MSPRPAPPPSRSTPDGSSLLRDSATRWAFSGSEMTRAHPGLHRQTIECLFHRRTARGVDILVDGRPDAGPDFDIVGGEHRELDRVLLHAADRGHLGHRCRAHQADPGKGAADLSDQLRREAVAGAEEDAGARGKARQLITTLLDDFSHGPRRIDIIALANCHLQHFRSPRSNSSLPCTRRRPETLACPTKRPTRTRPIRGTRRAALIAASFRT